MKTLLLTLTAVCGLFAASCSCHPGEATSSPEPAASAPSYVAPTK